MNKSFLLVVPTVNDAQKVMNVSSQDLGSLGVLNIQAAAASTDVPSAASEGLNLAALIGGIAAALFLLGLLLILFVVRRRRKRNRKLQSGETSDGLLLSTVALANERWFSAKDSSKWNKHFDRVRDEELLTMTAGIDLTFLEDPLLADGVGGKVNPRLPQTPVEGGSQISATNREDLL